MAELGKLGGPSSRSADADGKLVTIRVMGRKADFPRVFRVMSDTLRIQVVVRCRFINK